VGVYGNTGIMELQELRRNIGKKVYNICKNIAITRKKRIKTVTLNPNPDAFSNFVGKI